MLVRHVSKPMFRVVCTRVVRPEPSTRFCILQLEYRCPGCYALYAYRHNYNRTVRLGTVPGTVMYSRVVLDDLTTPNLLFLYDTHSRSARLNATVTGG